MTTVAFPDATLTAITVIDAATAVPVRGNVPNPRPTSFVTVRRTGGPRQNLVMDEATLAVECWAATDQAAHDLAQVARTALHAAQGTRTGGVTIGRVVEVSGPGLLPDPVSDHSRYTQTFTVATRGT